MIPVGTPVTVDASQDNYLKRYGMSREDLVVLAHSDNHYGLGPAKNNPAKAHSKDGWIFFSASQVTPKPQESIVTRQFKTGEKVEFVTEYRDGEIKVGDTATFGRYYSADQLANVTMTSGKLTGEPVGIYPRRLKLIEESTTPKVGDRVTVKGWEIDRQNPTWEGRTGVVTFVNSEIACIAFEDDKLYYKTGGFDFKYLVPAEEAKPFTFKDIQVGDTIRRTQTRKSGAKEIREGTVSKKESCYAEDNGYILAYAEDFPNSHMTLELLNRPEPEPVKEPWEDAERGTVIKRGKDHLVRNAGGWLFIYGNGNKVQRSQKDTATLLKDEKDLQVTPA